MKDPTRERHDRRLPRRPAGERGVREIGSTRLTLRELLALGESSVIELDRQAGDLLDVFVNGTLIGRGEVVTVGERFGVKMTELVQPEKRG